MCFYIGTKKKLGRLSRAALITLALFNQLNQKWEKSHLFIKTRLHRAGITSLTVKNPHAIIYEEKLSIQK